MVRRGKLERRKGNAGQWLVRLPPEGMTGPDRGGDAASDAGLAEVVAELKEEVTELRVALARSEAGHDAALAQVRAEGDARAAKAEAELAAERRGAATPEAQLAEAREPGLLRLLGGVRRGGGPGGQVGFSPQKARG